MRNGELAAAIINLNALPGNDVGKLELARGEVSQLIVNGEVGVKIDGSTTTVICDLLSSYNPIRGDVVEILVVGDRAVVLGSVDSAHAAPGTQTYAWTGDLVDTAGKAGYFPPWVIRSLQGQSVTIVGARAKVRAGTVTVAGFHNGVLMGAGMASMAVTSSWQSFILATPITPPNYDWLNIETSLSAGDGLSFSYLTDSV